MNNKWKMATGKVICPDIGKTGSGFFVGDRGFFVTNNHVVAKIDIDEKGIIRVDYSKQIFVKAGDKTYNTSLVIDENSDRPVVYDYAILKLDISPVAYFDVEDGSGISQGEEVIAMGYPLDFNELIITKGVISATISRPSHVNALHKIRTFLTDTLITYGNSGGPLIKVSNGKVIGITTMPHELRDEVRERLLKYAGLPEIRDIPPIFDLIEFVLRYLTVGLNYAISLEYALSDPNFAS